jgi:hypothetical protein
MLWCLPRNTESKHLVMVRARDVHRTTYMQYEAARRIAHDGGDSRWHYSAGPLTSGSLRRNSVLSNRSVRQSDVFTSRTSRRRSPTRPMCSLSYGIATLCDCRRDWAFASGYVDVSFKRSADASPVTLRGKQLRILKRQSDGSWSARVMSLTDSRKE